MKVNSVCLSHRPRSTCGKVLTENRPTCYLSSYRDYSPKPFSKAECIRSGTASGERRNNPHPPEVCLCIINFSYIISVPSSPFRQGFMVWRLPTRRRPHQDASDMEEPLHPDLGIIRGHLKSTYRDDYRENCEQHARCTAVSCCVISFSLPMQINSHRCRSASPPTWSDPSPTTARTPSCGNLTSDQC